MPDVHSVSISDALYVHVIINPPTPSRSGTSMVHMHSIRKLAIGAQMNAPSRSSRCYEYFMIIIVEKRYSDVLLQYY